MHSMKTFLQIAKLLLLLLTPLLPLPVMRSREEVGPQPRLIAGRGEKEGQDPGGVVLPPPPGTTTHPPHLVPPPEACPPALDQGRHDRRQRPQGESKKRVRTTEGSAVIASMSVRGAQ